MQLCFSAINIKEMPTVTEVTLLFFCLCEGLTLFLSSIKLYNNSTWTTHKSFFLIGAIQSTVANQNSWLDSFPLMIGWI